MRTVRGSESALRGESEARCGARGPEAAFPKEKATTGRSAFYFLGPQRSRSSVGWACPPCAHPRGDPAGPKSAPGHVRRQRALCTGTRHAPAAREAQGNHHPPPPPTCFSDLVKPDRDQRTRPVRARTRAASPGEKRAPSPVKDSPQFPLGSVPVATPACPGAATDAGALGGRRLGCAGPSTPLRPRTREGSRVQPAASSQRRDHQPAKKRRRALSSLATRTSVHSFSISSMVPVMTMLCHSSGASKRRPNLGAGTPRSGALPAPAQASTPRGGGEPLRIMRASRGAGQGRWCPSLRPEPQMRRAALPVPTHRRPQRAQGPPPQASSLLQSTATTPKAVRMVLVIPKNWSPCRLVDHRGQLTRVVKRGDSEGSARLGGWRCLPSGQPHTRHPTPRLTPSNEAEDVLFGPLCEK